MTTIRSKILAAAASVTLLGGITALTAGTAHAAPAPLPAYPATTTLDLGSPFCVTDDVIMNDPLDSTSPIIDTYGSAGNPVVTGHTTPPVTYSMWWLDPSNVWVPGEPPGVQINTTTGEVAAYDGTSGSGKAIPPATNSSWDNGGIPTSTGTVTYTIRDHGQDAVGAKGTTQYQIQVNNSGGTDSNGGSNVTVTYQGNDFNNADGALTIQLNGGSTTSTALTLSAIASSLHIPGSSPVTFSLVNPNGWSLSGGSNTAVLTGVSASDPEFKAVTTGTGPGVGPYDEVFFTLSGISTTSGGVFYTNNDANPCVTGPAPTPAPTTTTTPPPPSNYGDEVNLFGNGFDVYRQHASVNTPVIVWPATQADPATHFLFEAEGGADFRIEYAPDGTGTGLCISNPFPSGSGGLLYLRGCNTGPWQEFYKSGGVLISQVNGGVVNPDGKGSQWSTGASATGWGGSDLTFTPFASLPA